MDDTKQIPPNVFYLVSTCLIHITIHSTYVLYMFVFGLRFYCSGDVTTFFQYSIYVFSTFA